MKNLKRVFILLFLAGSFILKADDLLFKLSQGALNENMVGVKKLSEKEMKEVRGGAFDSQYVCYPTKCFAFADNSSISGTHIREWRIATLERVDHPGQSNLYLGFMAQNNFGRTSMGQIYHYFTYAAVILDGVSGQVYKQSNFVLKHNGIVRELSYRYKNLFDRSFNNLQVFGK